MESKVLDHGYVRLIQSWGSDEDIVESARMSTAKGFLGWGPKCANCGDSFHDVERDCPNPSQGQPFVDCGRGGHCFKTPGDEKLLKHLWDHRHSTPFEFGGLTVEVKAPLVVFREWHRHRTQGYSERSARYTPLPNENYLPSLEVVMKRATAVTKNKQAQSAVARVPTREEVATWLERLEQSQRLDQEAYEYALLIGVPKELARLSVPVARYSVMRATGNLRNWLHFLGLRCAPDAQYEIRQYANVVASFVKECFPRTHEVARESVGMP